MKCSHRNEATFLWRKQTTKTKKRKEKKRKRKETRNKNIAIQTSWHVHAFSNFIVILFSSLGWCVQFWSSPLWDLHPGTTRSLQARRASCHGDKPRTSRSYSEMPAARCWCKTKNGRHHWWTRTINVSRISFEKICFLSILAIEKKKEHKNLLSKMACVN